MSMKRLPRLAARAAASVMLALLAACGGGGLPTSADECSVASQQSWLGERMREWYFWRLLAPNPDPTASGSVAAYFEALLYKGGNPAFPADRWSHHEPSSQFERYYGEGRTLGYGMSVSGLEVVGEPAKPLRVRHVEALSDAAAQGIRRGDEVLSLDGRSSADIVAANDFSLLSAGQEGQRLSIELRDAAGVRRSIVLTASVYALTPVTAPRIVTSAAGRRLGYVAVKDMVTQALPGIEATFASLRAAGVDDLVLDLRYNGGGLVSVAAALASHAVGARTSGAVFAQLLYNDQRAAVNNRSYDFTRPAAALGLPRVFVLSARRTCSASEQVINGLKPFAEVVLIGETSCGKPVGTLPVSHCAVTYSAINFESVNARLEGRYFDGFAPACAVADDLSRALGDPDEALLAAARHYADQGSCPSGTAWRASPLQQRARPEHKPDGGGHQAMIAR